MDLVHFSARLTNQFDSVFADGENRASTKKFDIRLTTSRTEGTVLIRDGEGANESVLLEGERAENFFQSFTVFGKANPKVPAVEALRLLAEPYITHWK